MGFMIQPFVHSQMVASNWTLNDCSANSHTLFNYLDSQEVVVMEFGMGCASCTQAAGYLMNLKAAYDISHPGKVNWFYMDYWGNNCTDVNMTTAPYNFNAVFANCAAEETVYFPSVSPMPGIVIAAGNFHTVIYSDYAWYNSDTALIKSTIDQFFTTVGLEGESSLDEVVLYPNPVSDILHISGMPFQNEVYTVCIYDLFGKRFEMPFVSDNHEIIIQTNLLPIGSYVFELQWNGKLIRKSFVKN